MSSASTEFKGAAENAATWLKKVRVDGMGEILYGPNVEGSRVPVEVEARIGKSWAG
jgi:hypothetical protein